MDPKVLTFRIVVLLIHSTVYSSSSPPKRGDFVESSEMVEIHPDSNVRRHNDAGEALGGTGIKCSRNGTRKLPAVDLVEKIQKTRHEFPSKRLPNKSRERASVNSNCSNQVKVDAPTVAVRLPPLNMTEKAHVSFQNNNRKHLPKKKGGKDKIKYKRLPFSTKEVETTAKVFRKRKCSEIRAKMPNQHKMRMGRRHKLPKLKPFQITTTQHSLRTFTLPSRIGEDGERSNQEDCDLDEIERKSGDPKQVAVSTESGTSFDSTTNSYSLNSSGLFTSENTRGTNQPYTTIMESSNSIGQNRSGLNSSLQGRALRSWTNSGQSTTLPTTITTGESSAETGLTLATESELRFVSTTEINPSKFTTTLNSERAKGRGLSVGVIKSLQDSTGKSSEPPEIPLSTVAVTESENGESRQLSPTRVKQDSSPITESLMSESLKPTVAFVPNEYFYAQLKRRDRYKNRRKETEFLFGPRYREYLHL